MKNGRRMVSMIVLAAALYLASAAAHPAEPQTSEGTSAMKSFVFLFRQRGPQLSEADQKRRADEVRAWAQEQNRAGRNLDPRMLGEDSVHIGPVDKDDPSGATDGARLTAILFVEARDFDEAVSIAKTHPGLRYGIVSVEVRPWTPPPALQALRP